MSNTDRNQSSTDRQPRALALGRSRFGGGAGQLLLLVLGTSLFLAAGLSTVFSLLVDFQEGFWPGWINLTLSFWMVAAVISWFVFVDRSSLPKPVKNPEQTIEQSWRTRAQATVWRDLIILFSVGCFASAMLMLFADVVISWPLSLVCAGLVWFALGDYMIRYQMIKRAEG